ncbi:hypothetical protein J6590_012522 [Homalodisca vitripennis]|nr:hypothetical protein J6590_012522 [Homalodisca vitripennis]
MLLAEVPGRRSRFLYAQRLAAPRTPGPLIVRVCLIKAIRVTRSSPAPPHTHTDDRQSTAIVVISPATLFPLEASSSTPSVQQSTASRHTLLT